MFLKRIEILKKIKGGDHMKKMPLWILLIVLFGLIIPGIYQRFYSEWKNNKYELVIPYEEIIDLSDGDENWPTEKILSHLREVGLDAVSIEPESLKTLVQKGDVTVLTTERVNELALLSNDFANLEAQVTTKGVFIHINNENSVTQQISTIFNDAERLFASNKEFLFITDVDDKTMEMPLGFLEESVEHIKNQHIQVIPRIPNYTIEDNPYLYNQLNEIGKESNVLFLGREVLGAGEPEVTKKVIDDFNENKIGVYGIEFAELKGLSTIAHGIDMNVIRLHSMDLERIASSDEAIDRAIRAVKERNIRSLFIRLKDGETNEVIESTRLFLGNVQGGMPRMYMDGNPEPFKDAGGFWWIFAALASIIFATLTVLQVLNHRLLALLAGAGMSMFLLGYLILQNVLFLQALALAVAVITPILAVYPLEKVLTFRGLIMKYLRAVGVSVIGITIVVGLLNGNEFFVKMQEFRGVKLVYIIPILFALLYAVIGQSRQLLRSSVKYWHLVVLVLIGIVGAYYIIRTGNAATVSSIEIIVRQKLEELMYVRPRTKEFIIGLPIFVLALYLSKESLTMAKFFMIPGIIGFLSIVNTFTHLHIPLHVSILRTLYSLVLGFIIGLLYIQLYKIGMKIFNKYVKPRWTA